LITTHENELCIKKITKKYEEEEVNSNNFGIFTKILGVEENLQEEHNTNHSLFSLLPRGSLH